MRLPGPRDATRSLAAKQVLPLARLAGSDAGVTRLADVTRLDRFGLPVWQAVRPMSRALSVHQGKGASEAEAKVGALMEAYESHSAECFEAEGPVCRFDALSEASRARCLLDFAVRRERPPAADREWHWVEAEDIVSGGLLHLPFDVVSLDLTHSVPSRFDRTSNGVAAGASRDEASLIALHEFIERDSMISWEQGSLVERMGFSLDLETVPFDWMRWWRARVEEAGAAVRFYIVPTLTGTPLFACEINDLAKDGVHYRAGQGAGCHAEPEIALFKALAEALQARLTIIAGARDDLFEADYAAPRAGIRIAFGLPLPPGMCGLDWDQVSPGPRTPAALAEALAEAGYPQVALIALAQDHGITVMRAFVCGLGGFHRRRRPTLP